jgi:hypothetical protein
MTFPTLQSWPDFDIDGAPMSETLIGFDNAPIASVLDTSHHDAFLRLALSAPDMYDALKLALEAISAVPNYRIPGRYGGSYAVASLIEQALAKAKGQ